jgi:hypothetical protein
MSSVSTHCSSCGSVLEADCDFCPACGGPRFSARPPETLKAPHSWMGNTGYQNEAARSGPLNAPQYAPAVSYPPYTMSSPQSHSPDAGASTPRTLGIIALSLMAVGLIPCLGWINYINLVLSLITLIISIVASSNAKTPPARSAAMIGLTFALIAGFVGFIRLVLGGGCL